VQVTEAVLTALNMVPPHTWELLAPQLFVHLRHPRPQIRHTACHLLSRLSAVVPAAVLYSLVAEFRPHSDGTSLVALRGDAEVQQLTQSVSRGCPARVPQCRALIANFRKLTPLCAEHWHFVLVAVSAEVRRRLIALQMEAARIRQHKEIVAADELRGLLRRRYSTLLFHAISELQMHLKVRRGWAEAAALSRV